MTDILVEDHAEVDALLRGVLLAFDGGDAREVLPKLDYMWARLAVHIRAEHLHLFPALLSAVEGAGHTPGTPTAGEVRESVIRLRGDHDLFMHGLAEAVNGVRALDARVGAADAEGLRQIRGKVEALAARLAEHNRLEEEQVYLWQSALLPEEARAELRGRIRLEVENLPPRFAGRGGGA
jgi:Hemerythrin HHE cation binding domain